MNMAQTSAAPKYDRPSYTIKGQSLIAVPEIFQLRTDELGRDAVKLMNERFAGNSFVALDISSLNEDQPIGYSNPYRRFALGPIVRELYGKDADGKTVQLLTPAQSELALKHGTLPDSKNSYEDLAVVVYSTKGPNAQLAQHLVNQARERGKVKTPAVFYGLQTVEDDSFHNCLRLDLGDAAVAYHAPILYSNNIGTFDASDPELIKIGFPGKLGEGNRNLYIAKEGLRRVCRGWALGLYASVDDLASSYGAGRVSFIRGGALQNLEAALEAVESEARRLEESIEARKAKALGILGKH